MEKKGRMFFFEKKNQKTFIFWWCPRIDFGRGPDRWSRAGIKVFLLLFLQKKKAFLFDGAVPRRETHKGEGESVLRLAARILPPRGRGQFALCAA